MKYSRLLTVMALGLGLTLALLWMLRGPFGLALAETVCVPLAGSGLAPISPSLARQHDPVIISGGLLPDLTGSTLDKIFVYAYQSATPTQIAFQIDERDAGGVYIAVEDGQLDEDDELVFMAIDGGGWVGNPSLDVGGTPILTGRVKSVHQPRGSHIPALQVAGRGGSRLPLSGMHWTAQSPSVARSILLPIRLVTCEI